MKGGIGHVFLSTLPMNVRETEGVGGGRQIKAVRINLKVKFIREIDLRDNLKK